VHDDQLVRGSEVGGAVVTGSIKDSSEFAATTPHAPEAQDWGIRVVCRYARRRVTPERCPVSRRSPFQHVEDARKRRATVASTRTTDLDQPASPRHNGAFPLGGHRGRGCNFRGETGNPHGGKTQNEAQAALLVNPQLS
jgi:hypothetical protein